MQRLPRALQARGYRFVTPTPATHAIVNARPENAFGRGIEDVFGWSRPFRRGVLDDSLFELAEAACVLQSVDAGVWRSRVRASTLGDMMLLHSAYPTDAADAVFFGPDTYRFANAILHCLSKRTAVLRRAVDIGCGTGAGGLLIARAHPKAEILLTDLNEAALVAAQINTSAAGIGNVQFAGGDLLRSAAGDFDFIVANPPYLVDAAQRHYRHGGGALGAALSLRIVFECVPRLAPGGTLLLYTGSAIAGGRDFIFEALAPLSSDRMCRVNYDEVDPDVFGEELLNAPYDGVDRIAAIVLTVEKLA